MKQTDQKALLKTYLYVLKDYVTKLKYGSYVQQNYYIIHLANKSFFQM